MSSSFFFKDPTKLPCPCCGTEVDAGATPGSLKLLAKRSLICKGCGNSVLVKRRSYYSAIPLILSLVPSIFFTLPRPWVWLLPLSGILATFYFTGKEIQSTHLVIQDQIQNEAPID